MWKLQKALKANAPSQTGYKCGQYKFPIACAQLGVLPLPCHLSPPSPRSPLRLPLHLQRVITPPSSTGFWGFESAVFDFITLTNGVAPFKPTPFLGSEGPKRDTRRELSCGCRVKIWISAYQTAKHMRHCRHTSCQRSRRCRCQLM